VTDSIEFPPTPPHCRQSAVDLDFKDLSRAIYFAASDWLEELDAERLYRCRLLLRELLTEARDLYASPLTLRAFSDVLKSVA
jgi:hypothetical protein